MFWWLFALKYSIYFNRTKCFTILPLLKVGCLSIVLNEWIALPEELIVKKRFLFKKFLFVIKFNISFGIPYSDTCSTCGRFMAKVACLKKERKSKENVGNLKLWRNFINYSHKLSMTGNEIQKNVFRLWQLFTKNTHL